MTEDEAVPYYLYLATTRAFFEKHCSQFGTHSTPNHLALVGGQTPTLRNPPRGTAPQWDMPSVFGLADDHSHRKSSVGISPQSTCRTCPGR